MVYVISYESFYEIYIAKKSMLDELNEIFHTIEGHQGP